MKRLSDNWDAIFPIFKFSKDVRTAFYMTNAIELLNATLRRLNRQRSVFSDPQALLKHCILQRSKPYEVDNADPQLGKNPWRSIDHTPERMPE